MCNRKEEKRKKGSGRSWIIVFWETDEFLAQWMNSHARKGAELGDKCGELAGGEELWLLLKEWIKKFVTQLWSRFVIRISEQIFWTTRMNEFSVTTVLPIHMPLPGLFTQLVVSSNPITESIHQMCSPRSFAEAVRPTYPLICLSHTVRHGAIPVLQTTLDTALAGSSFMSSTGSITIYIFMFQLLISFLPTSVL